MTDDRRRLGVRGEVLAARWYRRAGYTVVDRNWRNGRRGELDLVLVRGRGLVVCEVKTRRSDRFGSPAEAVTVGKQRRIRALALAWIADHDVRPASVRFDVACVTGARVEIREGVF